MLVYPLINLLQATGTALPGPAPRPLQELTKGQVQGLMPSVSLPAATTMPQLALKLTDTNP